MKNNGYYQCLIKKDNITQIAFIPSIFAKINTIIKILGEDGWKIIFVGSYKETIPDIKKTIRSHRKNTGDSLPKCEN